MRTILFFLCLTPFILNAQSIIRELLPQEELQIKLKNSKEATSFKSQTGWRLLADKFERFLGVWTNEDSTHYEYLYDNLKNKTKKFFWTGSNWDSISYEQYSYDANENLKLHLSYFINSGNWEVYSKDSFTYNAQNLPTERIYSVLGSGNNLVNDYRDSFGYNSSGKEILFIGQLWNSVSWENNYKKTKVYDSNNNLLEYSDYSGNLNTWINNLKSIYSYDAQGRMLQNSNYSGISNGWMPNDSTVYYYSGSNLPDSLIYFVWNGAVQEARTKKIFYYNSFDQIDSSYEFSFNQNSWEPAVLQRNTYNAQNLQSLGLTYEWNSIWELKDSIVLLYNGSGKLMQESSYYQSGLQWNNGIRINYMFDTYGNTIRYLIEQGNGNIWDYTNQYHYYYESFMQSNINNTVFSDFCVRLFPNPADEFLNIEFKNSEGKDFMLRIINNNAKILYTAKYSSADRENLLLNIKDLPKGIYYLQIFSEKGCNSFPFIKK